MAEDQVVGARVCDQCALMRIDGWQGHTDDEPNWFRYIGVGDAPQLTNHLVDVLATRFGVPHPDVIQTVALPGYPFVPMQLLVLPASFANVLAQASGDLSLRTGGRVA